MKILKNIAFFLLLIGILSFSKKEIDPLLLPTSLKVIVTDANEKPVEGAMVSIFEDEKSYKSKENQIQETRITNAQGQVTFKKLKLKAYYVRVIKDELSNETEDVLTNILLEGRINIVTTRVN